VPGSGTGETITENCELPTVLKSPLVVPPRMEKLLEPNVPLGIPGAINTLKSAKGPLLAPGARERGALLRKGLSPTVKNGKEVVALSPFRKIVPGERLVSVASKVIVVPAAPIWLVCVSVI